MVKKTEIGRLIREFRLLTGLTVQFMCVEVLSRYLADATGMSLEAIRELIELDPDSPDSQLKQLLTKEQTKQLQKAINQYPNFTFPAFNRNSLKRVIE